MSTLFTRPDPDKLLRQVEAQEEFESHGRLKIFLGYASGVGKSFRMLDEGRRRRMRGEDVVVGAIQPVASPEVEALLRNLEVIPPKIIDGIPVLDVEAVLRRRPQVCLIDGLAYDHPLGAPRPKRWQDAEELLKSGISVVGTINIQYIEGRQEEIERITGKTVTQTVPLSFLKTAEEIEVVDAPPELCLERTSGEASRESGRPMARQLSELREIALLLTAEVVDHQLEEYLKRHGIEQTWGVQERILVCISAHPNGALMIASGRRNADRFHGELFVVHVNEAPLAEEENTVMNANLGRAREAGADVEVLEGEDAVGSIMRFAREHGVTQIFLGHSTHQGWRKRLFGSFVERMIRAAEGIDVRVFPQRG